MGSLRTKEGREAYRRAIADGILEGECMLCRKEAVKLFEYWKIVINDFPYNRIAETHDMIVPLRHVSELELSEEEIAELRKIKKEYIHPNYEWILEATPKKKTIPEHFHLHLLVAKD